MRAAHEIARDDFDYESDDASVEALHNLLRYLRKERKRTTADRPIATHFLTALVREVLNNPPREE